MSEFRRKLMMAYAANLGRGDIVYPGLIAAWSAKGKSNDDEDRATLRDLTGNGHDITLNGFAFSEMSGYGGYSMNLKKQWGNDAPSYPYKITSETKIILTPIDSNNIIVFRLYKNKDIPFGKTIRFKISNMKSGRFVLTFQYFIDKSINKIINYYGDFSIDVPTLEKFNPNDNEAFISVTFIPAKDTNVIIELLPEYPDALVFDGVDDYGDCPTIPSITECTLIAVRGYLYTSGNGKNNHCFIKSGNKSDYPSFSYYAVEYRGATEWASRLGNSVVNITDIIDFNKNVIWQNGNSYNGLKDLSPRGVNNQTGLVIGVAGNVVYTPLVFYSAYLFDRSLDEQEIKAFIRKYIDAEYLLPSEKTTT